MIWGYALSAVIILLITAINTNMIIVIVLIISRLTRMQTAFVSSAMASRG